VSRRYLTAEDSAIVLIDFADGFGWQRTHHPADHVGNVVALAEMAGVFDIPLVVTGPDDYGPPTPQGRTYPALRKVLGDHPVIDRPSAPFDAFEEPAFRSAVEATGRRRLVVAGLMTEGCLLQTALTAVADGYEVFVVVDACAGETREGHDAAIQRMVQAGVVPATWYSLAAEYQRKWTNQDTVAGFTRLIAEHSAPTAMHFAVIDSQRTVPAATA
jgi:nicotinamidase-related amidase